MWWLGKGLKLLFSLRLRSKKLTLCVIIENAANDACGCYSKYCDNSGCQNTDDYSSCVTSCNSINFYQYCTDQYDQCVCDPDDMGCLAVCQVSGEAVCRAARNLCLQRADLAQDQCEKRAANGATSGGDCSALGDRYRSDCGDMQSRCLVTIPDRCASTCSGLTRRSVVRNHGWAKPPTTEPGPGQGSRASAPTAPALDPGRVGPSANLRW